MKIVSRGPFLKNPILVDVAGGTMSVKETPLPSGDSGIEIQITPKQGWILQPCAAGTVQLVYQGKEGVS